MLLFLGVVMRVVAAVGMALVSVEVLEESSEVVVVVLSEVVDVLGVGSWGLNQ